MPSNQRMDKSCDTHLMEYTHTHTHTHTQNEAVEHSIIWTNLTDIRLNEEMSYKGKFTVWFHLNEVQGLPW